MGFRDVLFFIITAGTNLQWVATAAAGARPRRSRSGSSAFSRWRCRSASASSRSRRAIPRRAASTSGQAAPSATSPGSSRAGTYWMSNLPYFPGVLYFAAGNALYAGGPSLDRLLVERAVLHRRVADRPRVRRPSSTSSASRSASGSRTSARSRAGSRRRCSLALGAVAYLQVRLGDALHGRALLCRARTSRTSSSGRRSPSRWRPRVGIVYGRRDPRRPPHRAARDPRRRCRSSLVLYLAGTISVLVALPAEEITGMQGIMQAIQRGGGAHRAVGALPRRGGPHHDQRARQRRRRGSRRSRGFRSSPASTASCPEAFGARSSELGHALGRAARRRPLITGVFVFLGQAGTSVRGAYDALVSMTIIWYFIPFLYLFAAVIKLQRRGEGPGLARSRAAAPAVAVARRRSASLTTIASIVPRALPRRRRPEQAARRRQGRRADPGHGRGGGGRLLERTTVGSIAGALKSPSCPRAPRSRSANCSTPCIASIRGGSGRH